MDFLGTLPMLGEKTLEHIALTTCSLLLASAFAIPLGIWIYRNPILKDTVLKIGSISQTIPGLAMLALLVPILGLGNMPTLVVLTFYALYPILRSTTTGLEGVPTECIEAAQGLGFSNFQRLYIVELPLALPVIISGIRVATAMTIGITTIAALIGAGGLGDFITQGLALNDSSLILLGALPTAFLALTFDYGISKVERWIQNRRTTLSKGPRVKKTMWVGLVLIGVCGIGYPFIKDIFSPKQSTLVVGSKNFTEQYILAEIMAQLIEAKTSLKVKRKFNLGTTAILHKAMEKGEVDLYPEYTGTAYLTVLKKTYAGESASVFREVKDAYEKQYGFYWLAPFGFSNAQSIAIKKEFADKHHIQTLSDLQAISHKLRIAAPPSFLKRPDAFPALKKIHGLHFQKVMQVDPNLMYLALQNQKVDVIAAFTTDGKLEKYNLITLKDNKNFYPSYEAAPVVRGGALHAHPEIRDVLYLLEGKIDHKMMVFLNSLTDIEGQAPEEVAHHFLIEQGILEER